MPKSEERGGLGYDYDKDDNFPTSRFDDDGAEVGR